MTHSQPAAPASGNALVRFWREGGSPGPALRAGRPNTQVDFPPAAGWRNDRHIIEFPDGSSVLVTQLLEGQRVTVLDNFSQGSPGVRTPKW